MSSNDSRRLADRLGVRRGSASARSALVRPYGVSRRTGGPHATLALSILRSEKRGGRRGQSTGANAGDVLRGVGRADRFAPRPGALDYRTRTSRGAMAESDGRPLQSRIASRRMGAAFARIVRRKGAIAGNLLFARRTDRRRRPALRSPEPALRSRRLPRVHACRRRREAGSDAPRLDGSGTGRRLRNRLEFPRRPLGLPDGNSGPVRAP